MQLNVGDIVIGQNFTIDLEYNGMEGEIVGLYDLYEYVDENDNYCIDHGYCVLWATGEECVQDPYNLRKKKDGNADDTISWDECIWKPNEVIV